MQEFTSVSVYVSEHAKLTDKLNALSVEGWSVVSIVSTGPEVVAYLSRPATSSSTATVSSSTVVTPTNQVTPVPVPASEQNGWASVTSSASTTASTTKTPSVPADWYKDPAGRYEFRYWDGTKWTEHVSRGGIRYSDPPTP